MNFIPPFLRLLSTFFDGIASATWGKRSLWPGIGSSQLTRQSRRFLLGWQIREGSDTLSSYTRSIPSVDLLNNC